MGSASAAKRSAAHGGFSEAEFRALLDEVLTDVDRDERAGSVLQATGLKMRFAFPDLDMVLRVVASDDPHRHLEWSFEDDPDWQPKLELEMDSEVANGYLQGKESLAIAIARGKVRCKGESRIALLYLPAVRLLVEPYRTHITSEHPSLVV
jgi:hypothetical protein